MTWIRTLACIFLTSLVAVTAVAQQISGSIRGTVVDPSGAIVQSVAVSAQQTETGLTRAAVTDRSGGFVFVELPIGHYRILAEAKGYQKYLQEGISLDINETATVSIPLKVGAETQQVEVKADAELVQNTESSLGQTVKEREILDLPLDGRNFSQLGTLQPGVVPLTPGLLEAGGPARANQAYAVDGQRPESNNFLIDGADNASAVDGGFVLKPPIDAIAEFRILTHNANAEFGRNTGSTTNIVTRSGTNSFHGAAWEFLRNDWMDASDYFTQSVQPLKQNQFGATFGAPILKNKMFFFGYYEGFRNRQGETVPATVPSAAEQQGNFAELCTSLGAALDPTTGLCSNPQGQLTFFGTPVPFNQLTLFTPINPVSTNLLPFFPLPNSGTNGYIGTQTLSETNNQIGFRLDQHLNHESPSNLGFEYAPTLASAAGPPFIQIGGYASVGDPITGPRNT